MKRDTGGGPTSPEGPGLGRGRSWTLAVLVFAGGLAYSNWLLEFVVHTGLDHVNSFLSQLEEPGHPYRALFVGGDLVSAALLLIAAVLALVWSRPNRWYVAGWVLLGLFGAATIADASNPMSGTAESEASRGLFPQLRHVHALTSTAAVTAMFAAIIVFTVLVFRSRLFPVLRTVGVAFLALLVLATLALAVGDNLEQHFGDHFALGVVQRLQVAAMSAWLATLAFALCRGPFADGG
ncbi:DUF998 domain-containing protein [Rhodococcus sp. D2-41]|uniref:DUF998 domain-containing protein n=1 Tax=Speluncibacter jeojiensis TaxID=2710754 RepID=UPI00240F0DD5|nr:DUF998 domain-containing protein [Rhodococcus sp. D2-41]MDG3012012.1 DUF998 domain-containing protein [Rhodococcus sp. D2-41]